MRLASLSRVWVSLFFGTWRVLCVVVVALTCSILLESSAVFSKKNVCEFNVRMLGYFWSVLYVKETIAHIKEAGSLTMLPMLITFQATSIILELKAIHKEFKMPWHIGYMLCTPEDTSGTLAELVFSMLIYLQYLECCCVQINTRNSSTSQLLCLWKVKLNLGISKR